MMVIQRMQPITADSTASGIPETISQIIFKISEPAPPPYCTSFPNGKKHSDASLKHCTPTGIPTMVIHHRQPARHQLKPLIQPPKINHSKFPRHPILHTLLYSTASSSIRVLSIYSKYGFFITLSELFLYQSKASFNPSYNDMVSCINSYCFDTSR